MADEGPTTVGEILARLRMDISQYNREIREAKREAQELSRVNPNIRIDTNAPKAIAELRSVRAASERLSATRRDEAASTDRVTAAQRRLGDSYDKTTRKAEQARKSQVSVLQGALALSPALIPLAGVAVAGFGAITVGAGAAALAVRGIREEMKANTRLGVAYQKLFTTPTGDFNQLSRTGARTLYADIARGTALLHSQQNILNRDVATYSDLLGDAAVHIESGLLGGYRSARPLIRDILQDTNVLASRFDSFGSGGGFDRIVGTLRRELPGIEDDIVSIVTGVGKLVAAGAGSGLGILHFIGAIGDTLDAIPMPVLQTLAPLFLSTWAAIKLMNGAEAILVKASRSMLTLGVSSQAGAARVAAADARIVASNGEVAASANRAAAAQGRVGGVRGTAAGGLGRIGALLGGLDLLAAGYVAVDIAARAASKSQNTWLATTGDALASTIDPTYKGAPGSGSQLTKSRTDPGAQRDQLKQLAGTGSGGGHWYTRGTPLGFSDSGGGGNPNREAGAGAGALKGALAGAAAAQKQLNSTVIAGTPGLSATAKLLGMNASEALAMSQSQGQAAAQLRMQTAAMIQQNDAAGLLGQALGKLGGNNLGVAQSQTQIAQANNQVTQSFKDNGTAIAGTSDKALANQTALQGSASAAIGYAQALAQQTGSSAQANKALADSKTALENQLRAQGTLTPEVQKYINTLFNIPPIKPTKIDLQAAEAQRRAEAFKAYVAGLRGKTVSINAETGTAVKQLGAIREIISQIPNQKYVSITAIDATGNATNRQAGAGAGKATSKTGALGMIHRAYAAGGVENHAPQIASTRSGTVRVWAEPETHGESYIPHANDHRRPRAHQIMAQTAALLGGHYTAFATGGVNSASLAKQRADIQFSVAHTGLPRLAAAVNASASTVQAAMESLIGKVRAAAKAGLGSETIIPTLEHDNRQLQKYANQRDSIVSKLKAANDRLADLRSKRADTAAGIAGATASTFNPTGTQFADIGSLLDSLGGSADQAAKFRTDLASLRKRGVNAGLIQQLAEAGAGQAGITAATLAGGSGGQLSLVNKRLAALNASSKSIGNDQAGVMFNVGIGAAKSYAGGLSSELAAVKLAASKLAKATEGQLRHDLQIHSPSRVMAQLGKHTTGGYAQGMTVELPKVHRASGALATAAAGGAHGGKLTTATFHNIVNAAPGMDVGEIGREMERRVAKAFHQFADSAYTYGMTN